ncbi:MAG: nucleoside monophosphate kinase [Mycoplasmoidaceae bacterium]|nr:nucleoside monophosphate kinase [Mycoplasmoidaceae bacterium]
MIMILLGAPGSGKGSISNYLKEKHGFIHISTGDLFRKTITQDTPIANQLKQIMLSGKLVDDETTNEVVRQEILKINSANANIIFDGYPRNTNQLDYLNKLVKVDYAIDVQVDKDEIIKRITGRRVCPVCKEIYNIYYKKPKVENTCDNDGSLLVQRNDDQESVVIERYKTYMSLNAPLIDACKQMGILHNVRNDRLEDAIKQIKEICKLK